MKNNENINIKYQSISELGLYIIIHNPNTMIKCVVAYRSNSLSL